MYKMPELIEDARYPEKIKQIRTELEKIKKTDIIPSFDGYKIYCESYISENHAKVMVIAHGFTEFSKKYDEMIWYFFNSGYDVFIYDQRGHGLSERCVDDIHLTHIEHFEDYSNDLRFLTDNYVSAAFADKQLYLFGHSMGGAVSLLYLMAGASPFKSLILSSPMISPVTPFGIPKRSILNLVEKDAKAYGWDSKFRYAGTFKPDASFDKSSDLSYERFKDNLDLRIENTAYQNSSSTNKWLKEVLNLTEKLLNKESASNLKLDVLLLSAQKDTVVSKRHQKKMAKLLPSCKFIKVKNAKHSIFTAQKPMLEIYYSYIFDFLNTK